MDNQSYNSCDQCGYITDGKNKLMNHLQNHYNGLKRDEQYKTENGTQIGKDVRFLKLENSNRKNISRGGGKEEIGTISDVTKDSDIETPKLLEYITDPKAAETGKIARFMHDTEEKYGPFYWLDGQILERVTKV